MKKHIMIICLMAFLLAACAKSPAGTDPLSHSSAPGVEETADSPSEAASTPTQPAESPGEAALSLPTDPENGGQCLLSLRLYNTGDQGIGQRDIRRIHGSTSLGPRLCTPPTAVMDDDNIFVLDQEVFQLKWFRSGALHKLIPFNAPPRFEKMLYQDHKLYLANWDSLYIYDINQDSLQSYPLPQEYLEHKVDVMTLGYYNGEVVLYSYGPQRMSVRAYQILLQTDGKGCDYKGVDIFQLKRGSGTSAEQYYSIVGSPKKNESESVIVIDSYVVYSASSVGRHFYSFSDESTGGIMDLLSVSDSGEYILWNPLSPSPADQLSFGDTSALRAGDSGYIIRERSTEPDAHIVSSVQSGNWWQRGDCLSPTVLDIKGDIFYLAVGDPHHMYVYKMRLGVDNYREADHIPQEWNRETQPQKPKAFNYWEVEAWTEYLNQDPLAGHFLTFSFDSPRNPDLKALFLNGTDGITNVHDFVLSQEERKMAVEKGLVKIDGSRFLGDGIRKLNRADTEAVLRRYTGLGWDDLTEEAKKDFLYDAARDVYYFYSPENNFWDYFLIIKGRKLSDSQIELEWRSWRYEGLKGRLVIRIEEDGDWFFESNERRLMGY